FDPKRTGFECEGLVYTPDGEALKGLNPRNQWVRIADKAEGSETVELYVEAAANPVLLDYVPFVVTPLGDKETAGPDPLYRLGRLDLVVFDEAVWELINDIEVLDQLMRELPLEGARRGERGVAAGSASRVRRRDVVGAAAGVDRRAPARGLRAGARSDQGRPVRPGRRHVGRVGHQHARRRGPGPPVRPREAVLPGEVRRRDRGGLAAGLLRLHGRAAAAGRAVGVEMVPHPEDLVEPDQPVPASHVLVGGHRRHP